MKKKYFFRTSLACFIGACISFQGCTQHGQPSKSEITSLQADTTIFLKSDNQDSPSCNVVIDFMFLKPSSARDSVSLRINQILQRTAFGTEAAQMNPQDAVNYITNHYLTTYKKNLLPYYEADLKKGLKKDELPPWYNYQYNITSELSLARDSIYNYTVTNYQFTGGAHPNTFSSWTNINAHSGKILKKTDVFTEQSDKAIIKLIGKHLLTEVNKRLETDSITSIQGLWDNGILLNVDLYVPENFLITDQGIKFLYNRYDIAPYFMGDFQLTVPYAEIENLMIIK